MDLCFKGADAMNKSLGRAEDIPRLYVLLLDAFETDADLVSTHRLREFVFGFAVQGRDGAFVAIRHEDVFLRGFDDPGFNFPFYHGAQIFVFGVNGHHERGVDFAFQGFEVVEVFEEGRAFVPRGEVLRDAVPDPEGVLCGDGHEHDVLSGEADASEEGEEFFCAFFVAVLGPLDGRVVHFVDRHDEFVDALGFGQDGVFAGLASFFEPGLVFTLAGGDDEDADVGLGSPSDHGRDESFVAGRVEDGVAALVGFEEPAADLDGFALGAFFLGEVHDPGEVP